MAKSPLWRAFKRLVDALTETGKSGTLMQRRLDSLGQEIGRADDLAVRFQAMKELTGDN